MTIWRKFEMQARLNFLTKLGRVYDCAINCLAIFAAANIAFLMLGVCTDVVKRYFLGSAMAWFFECTEYSLLFITFSGAAWVLKQGQHIKVNIVLERFNPRTQTLIKLITSVASCIVISMVTWYGVRVTWDMYQAGYILDTVLRPPMFIILIIIPIGSLLLSIGFLREVYTLLRNWSELTMPK